MSMVEKNLKSIRIYESVYNELIVHVAIKRGKIGRFVEKAIRNQIKRETSKK
jgi:hypothetical protein